MAAPKSFVYETTTGTGTGNLTLANVSGWRSFSGAFGTGSSNTFRYAIKGTGEYETGIGYMNDATTLVRQTVIYSTNSNNAVNFSAGTKEVSHDMNGDAFALFLPAQKVQAAPIAYAYSNTTSAVGSHSATATLVPDLTVSFTLDETSIVRVSWGIRAGKSGAAVTMLYKNTSLWLPTAANGSGPPNGGWYLTTASSGERGNLQGEFTVIASLSSGAQQIDVYSEASVNTAAINWYERWLLVDRIA